MAKSFDSKRIVTTDDGRQMVEVTRTVKQRFSAEKVLQSINRLNQNIQLLETKKAKLQEFYDELTA